MLWSVESTSVVECREYGRVCGVWRVRTSVVECREYECCGVSRVRMSVVECREYECCGVLRVRTSVLCCRLKRERVCSAVRAKNC